MQCIVNISFFSHIYLNVEKLQHIVTKFFLKFKYLWNKSKYGVFIDTEECIDFGPMKWIVKIFPRNYHSVYMSILGFKNSTNCA